MTTPAPLLAAASSATESALDVSAAMWAAIAGLVILMLAADLVLFARGHARPPMRLAIAWSVAWLALAVVFGAGLWAWHGSQAGEEYFAGYLLERSLSLDNIFVFAVIFGYFAVPSAIQPGVLASGIALALVLRLIFILAGAALLATLHITFYAFGLLLLFSAYRLFRHEETKVDPEHNPALRLIRARVPMKAHYDGERLFVREAGRRFATPLLAVLVVIATTDLLFAIDSIPAIFAVTTEPFIVFAANAFALLGMRALYFVLAGLVDRFAYLSRGLAAILGVIGVKMLAIDLYHPPIWLSLAAIVAILTVAIGASIWAASRREGRARQLEGNVVWHT